MLYKRRGSCNCIAFRFTAKARFPESTLGTCPNAFCYGKVSCAVYIISTYNITRVYVQEISDPLTCIFRRRRQLPSIEEAWNLPISAEMSSRAPKSAPPPYPGKRPEEPPPLTQHQLQTLQFLQKNSNNLSPQQQVLIYFSSVKP